MREHCPQFHKLCWTNLLKNSSQREEVLWQTSPDPLRTLLVISHPNQGRSHSGLRNSQRPHFQTAAKTRSVCKRRRKTAIEWAPYLKDRETGAGVQLVSKVKRPLRTGHLQKTRSWQILSLTSRPQIHRDEEENTKDVRFSPQNGKKRVRPHQIDRHQRRKSKGERVQVETRIKERPL